VVLGDAAHPTLPFLAQGANLAIEDAYVLAQCCQDATSLPSALHMYQTMRRDRVVRAISAAQKNAKNYHLSGVKRRLAFAGLKTLGAVAPDAFINRLGWLYNHDVTA
jgi:salicylate hydroxylase